jgi:hypothetical protein
MPPWQTRLRDARDFRTVAGVVADPKHGNQAASNAILGAIAANDAICLRLGRPQPAGESHIVAVEALTEACRGTQWEAEARQRRQQLAAALRLKADAHYSGRLLTVSEVARALRQAERFIDWAEKVCSSAGSA